MSSPPILPFPGPKRAAIQEVGGKAASLIRLTAAGLPVPGGAVLTTRFFRPWYREIQASAPWAAFCGAEPDRWAALCNELKELCPGLRLTETQRRALEDLRRPLIEAGEEGLFAVRSSSPEEDLATASFAGGYETVLGVRPASLADAVRRCFASSLDARVAIYKQEHGFDVLRPRLAVVVQRQIASEVSGVAFSLNPLTNDYDEAVLDANWGLGESVVGGLTTPDHFVVDRVTGRVLEKRLGEKDLSIWLSPGGGTEERHGHRSAEWTLGEEERSELIDVLGRVEALYGRPIDLEWAYAGERLHLLQARPITTHVPLPPEMVTAPGERRLLYGDAALSGGLAINAPISPMGLDWMKRSVGFLADSFLGGRRRELPLADSFWLFAGARMYQNLSSLFWLPGQQRLAKAAAASDALMSDILMAVDAGRYRTPRRPPWAKLRMLRVVPRMAWRARGLLWGTLVACVAPDRAHRAYRRRVETYEATLAVSLDHDLPLGAFLRTAYGPAERQMVDAVGPALAVGLAAVGAIERVARRKDRSLAEKLTRGFEGNVVIEMGIALFRLAQRLDPADFEDLGRLAERLAARQLPTEFLDGWDAFLRGFGWRGPMEMDLARPRYQDEPTLALRQMALLADDDGRFDPAAAHRRQVAERHRAYERLMSRSGPLRRAVLRRLFRLVDLFGGARETPKHHNLLLHQAVRRRALLEGQRLVEAGRVDAPEEVFGLTFDDLESADRDPMLDLRRLRERRTAFFELLGRQVKSFPAVIDSRGRILRPPPRPERPGELSGMAVSPGVVTGPVKRLHDPFEKPLLRGEVLVAYATDPGWTPLFANAAAVVLEVGGVLQHGAVVAREYGKPCVVGIDRVMDRLRDGQRVEVDGTAGVVRLLS